MPQKKANSKKDGKKVSRRFAIPRVPRFSASDSMAPSKIITTLKYGEQFTLTSTSGVPAFYEFRANSCYDPNVTSGGHQPRGFDQWIGSTGYGLYQKGLVLESSISVQAIGLPATAVPIFVALNYNTTTSPNYTVADLLEIADTKHVLITGAATTTNGLSAKLFMKKSPKSHNSNVDDNYFSSIADAPYQQYFGVYASPVSGTTEVIAQVVVEITYTVMLFDRVVPFAS